MKIIFPVYDDYDDGFDENQITSRMLCASNPGKDACQGDSGGDSNESSDDVDVDHYEILHQDPW